MNILIVDENKNLTYVKNSEWYQGENDFEQLRVEIPNRIGRRDTVDLLSGISLMIVLSDEIISVSLTFSQKINKTGYYSNIIPVDDAWCEYTGHVVAYLEFEDSLIFGLTNSVTIPIKSNVNEDVPQPVDEFARKTYVDNAVDEVANSIPTELSELSSDSTHRLVTDAEKEAWNTKADISDIPAATSQITNDSHFGRVFYKTIYYSTEWFENDTFVDILIGYDCIGIRENDLLVVTLKQ